MRIQGAWIGAALAAVALAGGCGQQDDPAAVSTAPTQTVQKTTRVEVIKQVGGAGAFDPAAIYKRAAPGVVTITATGLSGTAAGNASLGSGFVISGDGEVATNAHVVTTGQREDIAKAKKVYVKFSDGNQVRAKILGFDPFADVALLKIHPEGLTLRPLPLGSAKDAVVGAPVAAIGAPFGEEESLSVGVISATGRPIQSLTAFDTAGAIQTDAAINHGNSGGPLIDAEGKVLGITSQIQSSGGDNTGVGFAVPVDTVRNSLAQIRADGRVRYAYIGLSTTSVYPQLGERFDLGVDHGAWVQELSAGGPADKAGIRGGTQRKRFQARPFDVGGDVIVKVGHKRVVHDDDVALALMRFSPGDSVPVVIYREGERRTINVKLGERPLSTRPRG
jgi:S1-C subfamily serine protease